MLQLWVVDEETRVAYPVTTSFDSSMVGTSQTLNSGLLPIVNQVSANLPTVVGEMVQNKKDGVFPRFAAQVLKSGNC